MEGKNPIWSVQLEEGDRSLLQYRISVKELFVRAAGKSDGRATIYYVDGMGNKNAEETYKSCIRIGTKRILFPLELNLYTFK